jgi:MFS family permease
LLSLLNFKDKIFYGWVVVATFLIIGITIYGIHFSFGVFFKSIESEFGLTRAATSAILSVNLLFAGFYSFFAGWALDRYGPKLVVLSMGVFAGLSLVLTSLTNSLWQLFITYSLLLAMGTGPLFVVPMSAVSRWFDKQRGLALGLATLGVGLGTVIMAPFATYLIANFDWHTAYLIIGLIAWLIIVPLSLLLKRNPREVGALPDGRIKEPKIEYKEIQSGGLSVREALRTRSFWIFALIWFLFAACLFLIYTHLVPHITDRGFSAEQAATVLSLLGAASIFGRLLMGIVSDRLGRKLAMAVCTLIAAGAILWLVQAEDLWHLYLFALVFGFFYSGFGTSGAALVSDTFGLGKIGSIFGLLEISFGIGAALGPFIGGIIFDVSQKYSLAFLIGAGAMLLITLLVPIVRRERGGNFAGGERQ